MAVRRLDPPNPADPQQMLFDSLRVAIAESRTISIAVTQGGRIHRATVAPDGSATADSLFHYDRLDGRRRHAR
jgi:hypothetical protein